MVSITSELTFISGGNGNDNHCHSEHFHMDSYTPRTGVHMRLHNFNCSRFLRFRLKLFDYIFRHYNFISDFTIFSVVSMFSRPTGIRFSGFLWVFCCFFLLRVQSESWKEREDRASGRTSEKHEKRD